MANWQSTLNIKSIWSKAKSGDITTQELSKVISDRLIRLRPCNDPDILEERDNLASWFKTMSEDENLQTDEFDSAMEELYEWGDISLNNEWPPNKVCWIATF